jgi:hypothetical protein
MNLENELRELLRAKAAACAPSLQPCASVVRRGRIRLLRRAIAAALVIAGAALVATALQTRVTPSQRAFAAFALDTASRHSDAPSDAHADPADPVTLAMLKKNNQCLREHGFDLPAPVKTAQGWQVIVEDSSPLPSESPDYKVRKRWAQAVFVDCRLMDATDDLVLGGRTRQQIEDLMDCARARGFALPAPAETKPGEFEFDLSATAPPWGSQAWYQTVFVTCGLWRHAPATPR